MRKLYEICNVLQFQKRIVVAETILENTVCNLDMNHCLVEAMVHALFDMLNNFCVFILI